jgi:hypothetical protein
MSDKKTTLKIRSKKKMNATQLFINLYDTDETNDNTHNKDDNKKIIINNNKINDIIDNVTKNNKDSINDIKSKTYVNNDNVVDVNDKDDSYLRDLASGKKLQIKN